MFDEEEIKNLIRKFALQEGFCLCGFASVHLIRGEIEKLREWADEGCAAGMEYLKRNFEIRANPAHEKFFPDGRTMVIFAGAYHHCPPPDRSVARYIARYARGFDYHGVFFNKINNICRRINSLVSGFGWRVFVDSSPVMEKLWAIKAGIGWRGKNSLVVNARYGSYFLLGGAITNLELQPDSPVEPRCGDCRLCIEACPTNAIREDFTVDARRCLAYHTVESCIVDESWLERNLTSYGFGCDLCQQVCPYNTGDDTGMEEFKPFDALVELETTELVKMELKEISRLIEGSPLKRAGAEKVRKTFEILLRRLRGGGC